MRHFILFIVLAGCTATPPDSATPAVSAPVPYVEEEVEQAAFLVGVRTKSDSELRRSFDDGSELTITGWALVLSAVEVHLCEDAAWQRFFIGTAYAHVSNSITRLGTPVAEDLLRGTGSAKMVGEIAPPLGSYCRAFAVFTPADEDVLNFTLLSDADLLGHTAIIRGELTKAGETPLPIQWVWDRNQVSAMNLDAVRLTQKTDSFLLLVDKKVDAKLLDGLTVDRVRSGEAVDDLMMALFSRVALYRSGAQ